MSSSFIPKGQEGLLLRDPLTFGFSAPTGAKDYKPIYSKQHDVTHKLSRNDREILQSGSTPKKVGFYTRHNPHPVRVRHIKGLNDAPICYIEDNTNPRYLTSPPSGQDYGCQYQPPGSTRFSARGDLPPAVGVVPVTYAWRDELEKKASSAINRALGQPPSRGGAAGRASANQFDQIDDNQLLELLCRILQTDSIPACQAWLRAASDSEKTIVLNMIRMAASGDFAPDSARSRPQTSDSDVRYVWAPERSQAKSKYSHNSYLEDEDFKFSLQEEQNDRQGPGIYDAPDNPPFKLPENDTIVKTARQLSNLASRQGSRCGTANTMLRSLSKELPSPSRTAQLAMVETLSKSTSEQLQTYLKRQSREKRTRSATMSGPMATKPNASRPRSRSATAGVYPPPPVKVTVTQEKLRGVGGAKTPTAKLQYTSHWGSQ